MSEYSQIAGEGLWRNNPALVQLLGLCPLLAVSNSFVTALGLGLVTLGVLTTSNIIISLIRNLLHDVIRLPIQIMVIATSVTLADMALQAWYFELHQRIGLFVALIVTNCTLLGRAESFASRNPIVMSAVDGFMMGTGFLWVLLLLGTVREVFGMGTLFNNLHLLLGPAFENVTLHFADSGFLLLVLPPGAFLSLGCLIALKNYISGDQY
ncbi:MAG TPA: electron transport complex subunit RsxE [Gammaproteobacteria bacterium]|nr:electron transport complex subunit RsxE [Gammaproteobacteria bacterium]